MQVHTASRPATRHQPGRQAGHYTTTYYLARQAVSVCVASQQYILYSHNIEKLPWQPARQDWLDLGPGLLAWWTNEGKLSARFSMDLLPGFEILAGKCVLCNTDATAGTASGWQNCLMHPIYIQPCFNTEFMHFLDFSQAKQFSGEF